MLTYDLIYPASKSPKTRPAEDSAGRVFLATPTAWSPTTLFERHEEFDPRDPRGMLLWWAHTIRET